MKLIQQLLEMAKSSSKRKSQAKRRRKKKAEKPSDTKSRNLVAKDAYGMTGAGAHKSAHSDANTKRGRRKQGKAEIKNQMDY